MADKYEHDLPEVSTVNAYTQYIRLVGGEGSASSRASIQAVAEAMEVPSDEELTLLEQALGIG